MCVDNGKSWRRVISLDRTAPLAKSEKKIYTVNFLLIEIGYNEMTAYIEVSIFPYTMHFTDIAPLITKLAYFERKY